MILKAELCIHPVPGFCEGAEIKFPPFLVVSVKDTLLRAGLPLWLLYLLVGSGLLHAPAEGLRAREARRAGQAVVAGVCVLAPVLSVVVEAGVGH